MISSVVTAQAAPTPPLIVPPAQLDPAKGPVSNAPFVAILDPALINSSRRVICSSGGKSVPEMVTVQDTSQDLAAALQDEAARVETGNFTGETSRFVLDTGGPSDLNNPLCPDATKPLAAPEQ